jgi:hypothetical protein
MELPNSMAAIFSNLERRCEVNRTHSLKGFGFLKSKSVERTVRLSHKIPALMVTGLHYSQTKQGDFQLST